MLNKLRLNAQDGFTLIELLVVIAIIGILAAIAIPQFAAYRRRAFASQVISDMRNVAAAEESAFAANQAYVATVCASPAVCAPVLTGFLGSSTGVTVTVVTPSPVGGVGTFQITGAHNQCGADAWTYESGTGEIATVPLVGLGVCA